MRVLTRNVTIHTDDGVVSVGPGECPDRLADLIEGFPGLWADEGTATRRVRKPDPTPDVEPTVEPDGDDSAPAVTVDERPSPGDDVEVWRAYATSAGLTVRANASKAKVMAAVRDHWDAVDA